MINSKLNQGGVFFEYEERDPEGVYYEVMVSISHKKNTSGKHIENRKIIVKGKGRKHAADRAAKAAVGRFSSLFNLTNNEILDKFRLEVMDINLYNV